MTSVSRSARAARKEHQKPTKAQEEPTRCNDETYIYMYLVGVLCVVPPPPLADAAVAANPRADESQSARRPGDAENALCTRRARRLANRHDGSHAFPDLLPDAGRGAPRSCRNWRPFALAGAAGTRDCHRRDQQAQWPTSSNKRDAHHSACRAGCCGGGATDRQRYCTRQGQGNLGRPHSRGRWLHSSSGTEEARMQAIAHPHARMSGSTSRPTSSERPLPSATLVRRGTWRPWARRAWGRSPSPTRRPLSRRRRGRSRRRSRPPQRLRLPLPPHLRRILSPRRRTPPPSPRLSLSPRRRCVPTASLVTKLRSGGR